MSTIQLHHSPPAPMGRRQLAATLIGCAVGVVVLLVAFVYGLVRSLMPNPVLQGAAEGPSVRDSIAAAPMPQLPASAASTPSIALMPPPAGVLPAASRPGPAGVRTGFPQTPQGAVAQLAAIETRVLGAMSLPLAVQVYQDWAMPGGVGPAGWSQTRAVERFLSGARQESTVVDDGVLVSVFPAGYQVKGVDGPDWVLACVLLDVRASIVADARIGYGTCERMQWQQGRWLIAPGAAPALAPSAWPGSQVALDAGWLPISAQ